jgi:DNA-directed RNA polymerase subunit RPC12/RpoP
MTNKLTGHSFHCMKCGKNRTVKAMRTIRKQGKDRGLTMDYYTAHCPKCGSRMMKIKEVVGMSRAKSSRK